MTAPESDTGIRHEPDDPCPPLLLGVGLQGVMRLPLAVGYIADKRR